MSSFSLGELCHAASIEVGQYIRRHAGQSLVRCMPMDVEERILCEHSFTQYVVVGKGKTFLVNLSSDSAENAASEFVVSLRNACADPAGRA